MGWKWERCVIQTRDEDWHRILAANVRGRAPPLTEAVVIVMVVEVQKGDAPFGSINHSDQGVSWESSSEK
jgi:hypothetical protein